MAWAKNTAVIPPDSVEPAAEKSWAELRFAELDREASRIVAAIHHVLREERWYRRRNMVLVDGVLCARKSCGSREELEAALWNFQVERDQLGQELNRVLAERAELRPGR